MSIRTAFLLGIISLATAWGAGAATQAAPTVPAPPAPAGIPDYNRNPAAPVKAGMASTAEQLAGRIRLGLNIGNALEAIGGETAWGNPKVTPEFVRKVKSSGFNAIRIPVSWNQYADPVTAKIDPAWLDRIREVVKYCTDNDLYVIVNIHWDKGWLENNVTPEKQVANNARQRALWEQIASHLGDFDEHLLFASANEPNVKTAAEMEVLLSYHQTFIDAVRATGGRNAYRVVVVQGPDTDIEKTTKLWTTMPKDKVAKKMMAEVHFYTPYNFALMTEDASYGKQFYYWGRPFHSSTDIGRNATWGEEDAVDRLFLSMKQQFVDKGIPLVIGEYAAIRRSNLTGDALALHAASHDYWVEYVTRAARRNGLLPFYWDTGRLIDRRSNAVLDKATLDALLKGAGKL